MGSGSGPAHYWNRSNFEGLLQLAEALAEDTRLDLLAQYCRMRERCLRRSAFEALHTFIDKAAAWDPADARETCQRILELHALTPEAHQFLTQPLLTRFLFPVLDAWLADAPSSLTALRWLGILRGDVNLLRRALALLACDVPVRRKLADELLSQVDFATHHLVESRLLCDLEETRRALAAARTVTEAAPDRLPFEDILGRIEGHEALLRDWG